MVDGAVLFDLGAEYNVDGVGAENVDDGLGAEYDGVEGVDLEGDGLYVGAR